MIWRRSSSVKSQTVSGSSLLKGRTSHLLRKTANKQKTKTGAINTPVSKTDLKHTFLLWIIYPPPIPLFHHFKIILTTFHTFSTMLNGFMFSVFLNTTRFVSNLIPSELQHKEDSALHLKFQSSGANWPAAASALARRHAHHHSLLWVEARTQQTVPAGTQVGTCCLLIYS